jgi:hypothetical protein
VVWGKNMLTDLCSCLCKAQTYILFLYSRGPPPPIMMSGPPPQGPPPPGQFAQPPPQFPPPPGKFSVVHF